MSDEEEDYMSDAFLASIAADAAPADKSSGDVRKYSAAQRKRDMEKKAAIAAEKSRTKPLSLREKEAREDALAKPIAEDNKGFALLKKMGFKPGQGLGKEREGRAEPIGINIREVKLGLGMEAKRKADEEAAVAELASKRVKATTDFRSRLRLENQRKTISRDVVSSQRVVEELDTRAGKERTHMWLPEPKEEGEGAEEVCASDEEEEDADEEAKHQKQAEFLAELTKYLRGEYCYCIWCGYAYADGEQLRRSCPGPTREDHDE